MKVEIIAVGGVAGVSAPNLQASLRVAGKHGHRMSFGAWAVHDVGVVDRLQIPLPPKPMSGQVVQQQPKIAGHHLVGREEDRLFDEMSVDKEIFNSSLGQCLFYSDSCKGRGWFGVTIGNNRRLPQPRRAIAALGNPHAARLSAQVALVHGDCGADLCDNTLVGPQQRQISVGRRAGKYLDGSSVVEMPKAFHDVAVEFVEVDQGPLEEFQPEDCGLGITVFAILAEVVLVFARRVDLALNIFREFLLEGRMRKLFEQHGREAYVCLQR